MTASFNSTRDERAQATVDAVVRGALQTPAPKEIAIEARDNHSGEPSLYVYIVMPEDRHIPDVATQNQLSSHLLTALQRLDDNRFPYVFYGPRGPDLHSRRRGGNR